ncbi:MAG TPA: cysteine peptidase family C39 domain-containing protein [Pirellulales bacterium]|nr:cysteine peptidase family C39 domain-containing protein [Pirellulales bacterium]
MPALRFHRRRLPVWLLLASALCAAAPGCQSWPRDSNDGAGGLVRDRDHQFRQEVDSWKEIREEDVVMQRHDYSCGAAAMATVAQYYWNDNLTEDAILKTILRTLTPEEHLDRLKNGLSLADMRHAAVNSGYLASIGKLEIAKLSGLKIPIIVRIVVNGQDHFVVVRGMVGDRVFLADPIRGKIRLSVYEFAEQWQDRALLVMVKKGVKPPTSSPLLVAQHEPVQPELQAGRRSLFLTR